MLSKAFVLEAAPGRLLAELWSNTGLPDEWTQVASTGDKAGLPGEWTQVASAGDKAPQPILSTYKTQMEDTVRGTLLHSVH